MEWIRTSDRLPEHGERVLICSANKVHGSCVAGVQVAVYRAGKYLKIGNNKTTYVWDAPCGPMSWFGQDVTHWMPLPDPPR